MRAEAMSFRLGYHLVEAGQLTVIQADQAMRRQLLLGGSLDTHLLELGWLSLDELSEALAETYEAEPLPEEWLLHPDPDAIDSVPHALVEQFQVLPIRKERGTLHLLIADHTAPPELLPLEYWLDCPIELHRIPQLRLQQGLAALCDHPLPNRFQTLSRKYPTGPLFAQHTPNTPTPQDEGQHTPSEETPAPPPTEDHDAQEPAEEGEALQAQGAEAPTADEANTKDTSTKEADAQTEPATSEESQESNVAEEAQATTENEVDKDTDVVEASEETKAPPEAKAPVEADTPKEDAKAEAEKADDTPQAATEDKAQTAPPTASAQGIADEEREASASAEEAKEEKEANEAKSPPNEKEAEAKEAPESAEKDRKEAKEKPQKDKAKRPRKGADKRSAPLSLPPLDRLRSAFRPSDEEGASEGKQEPTNAPKKAVQAELAKAGTAAVESVEDPGDKLNAPQIDDVVPEPEQEPKSAAKQAPPPAPKAPTEPKQARPDTPTPNTAVPGQPTNKRTSPMQQPPVPAPSQAAMPAVKASVTTAPAHKQTGTQPLAPLPRPNIPPPTQVPASKIPSSGNRLAQEKPHAKTTTHVQLKNAINDPGSTQTDLPKQSPSSAQLNVGSPAPQAPLPNKITTGSLPTLNQFQEGMTIPGLPAFPPLSPELPQPTRDIDIDVDVNAYHTIDEDQTQHHLQQPDVFNETLADQINDYLSSPAPQHQDLLKELVPHGGGITPTLLSFFPPTESIVDKNPEVKERFDRIVTLCQQIGDPIVFRLLQILEREEHTQQRMQALLLLGLWLPPRAIAPLLQRLFSEKEPVIQKMVRNNLRGYRKRSEFSKLLQFLRENLRSKDLHRLQKATFFLGDLRIIEAIPDLVGLLNHESPQVRESALIALRNLTLQDFGANPQGWQQWHQANTQRDRKHWVVDALNHPEKAIRHLAKEELRAEFGDDFGYNPKATAPEREAVQKLAKLWLQQS